MFVYKSETNFVILLLYVDDIILIGNKPQLLHLFIDILSYQFAMKDLGGLHYFLGGGGHYFLGGQSGTNFLPFIFISTQIYAGSS